MLNPLDPHNSRSPFDTRSSDHALTRRCTLAPRWSLCRPHICPFSNLIQCMLLTHIEPSVRASGWLQPVGGANGWGAVCGRMKRWRSVGKKPGVLATQIAQDGTVGFRYSSLHPFDASRWWRFTIWSVKQKRQKTTKEGSRSARWGSELTNVSGPCRSGVPGPHCL